MNALATADTFAAEPDFGDPATIALRPDADVVMKVRGLSVSFGGIHAVSNVSFDLVRGEILGVVGPNGAGKTTMFDAISGFVTSGGTITLDGHDVGGLSPEARSRARLGRSFQDARLFPSLTVFETLNLSLERHLRAQDPVSTALTLPWVRRSERESAAKATELIGRMGLAAFRDKFISELSTGTRRIVDLACIMAHDPLVLLLDEPSSGIAQREAEALGPVLLRLREDTGVSIVIIEHDMPLLLAVSDRLLALETGSVLTAGSGESVLNDPRLIAAYLGSNEAAVHRSGTATREPEPASPAEPDEPTTAPTPAPRKRAVAKKAAPARTAATKKATVKKAAPTKKAAVKKAAPKTTAPARKAAPKKTTPKKTTAKQAAPKKAAPKKTASKTSATKKAAPAEKATPKKATSKKTAASAKKAATKKKTVASRPAQRGRSAG